MEPSASRTIQDVTYAIRRSWRTLVALVLVGALLGLLLGRSSATSSAQAELRIEDRNELAVALGLSANSVTTVDQNSIEVAFNKIAEGGLAGLPDDVVLTLVTADEPGIIAVSASSDDSDSAAEWALTTATAVALELDEDQLARIAATRSFHESRLRDLEVARQASTSDIDSALLLVEQTGHLDTLGGISVLENAVAESAYEPKLESAPEATSGYGIMGILAGAALGLFVAFALIYARLLGDRTIRRSAELEASSGVETLATLPGSSSVATTELLTPLAASLQRRYSTDDRILVIGTDQATDAAVVAHGLSEAMRLLDPASSCAVVMAPSIGAPGSEWVSEALRSSATILVATYGKTSGPDARAVAQAIRRSGADLVGAILVSVPAREYTWAAMPTTNQRRDQVGSTA